MSRKTLSPASVFEMVLRAHESGGVTFVDVRTQLKQLLASGASPADLLKTFRRQEQWEPLPESAHVEVLGLIDEAMRAAPKNDDAGSTGPEPAMMAAGDSTDTVRDDSPDFAAPDLQPVARESAGEQSRVQLLRTLESRIAGQQADYTSLTRAYERARESESGATARVAALTTDLSTAHAEAEAERARLLDMHERLAAAAAAETTLRSQAEVAMRETRAAQDEARGLRDSKQLRDAEFEALERKLIERDAQLESLEHAREALLPQWTALAAELSAAHAALAAERSRTDEISAALQAERARTAPLLDAGSRAAAQLDSDLQAARAALAAGDATMTETRRLLGVRDTDLAALQQEHARTTSLLDEQLQAAAQYAAELRGLRDSAATRDAALAQAQRLLSVRNAELATLQQERARTEPLLAAGTKSATQLQSDLHAARAALGIEQAKGQALRESLAVGDATLAELRQSADAALARSEQALRTAEQRHAELRESMDTQLHAANERIDALHRALVEREAALVSVPAQAPSVEASPIPLLVPERVSSPPPPPSLLVVPQSHVLPRSVSAANPARAGRVNKLGVLAAAAAIVLCGVAAFILRHRTLPPAPAVVSIPLPVPKAGTVVRDCLTCPEVTVLPTGKFSQGSADASLGPAAFEKPLHVVAIRRVIGMATNLVTVDEFQQFVTASGWDSQGCNIYDGQWKNQAKNSWSNPGFAQTGKHPVTCASWNDAQAYAKWVSAKAGHTYRLPSASEWEYAARAGGEAVAPWSTEAAACENANVADQSAVHRYPGWAAFDCSDGYVYTSPVGSFKANAFGLNDMLGNVFQWTEDCWRPDYVGAPIDGSARSDGQCAEHELRGGSWFTTPAYVRANYRNHFTADYRSSTVGIRLVRDFGA